MKNDVIIACDFKNKADTLAFLDRFEGKKPYVKIGMELFYGEGPDIVREIRARGHEIFLDLKLHDIPNTVKKAMANLARLGVSMTNVHAAGTIDMMRAAVEGLELGSNGPRPLLIAVRARGRAGRRRLLAARGRAGQNGLRRGLPDRNAGHPLSRRRTGRPVPRHHAAESARDWLGLHCRRPSHHGGCRPRGRV